MLIKTNEYNTPTVKNIISVILFSFLITFIIARLIVYMVLGHWVPNFFLTVRGVHVHHFTYGVFILAIVGLYLILLRPDVRARMFEVAVMTYGVGLALTFDEFGMWIRLQDNYWVRQSYDAVIVIVFLFLNLAYLRPLTGVIKRRFVKKNNESAVVE